MDDIIAINHSFKILLSMRDEIVTMDVQFEAGKKKGRSRVGEGSSNITMKLKYIIIIPVYSFTDKLHCLINTATVLLELLTALLGYLDRL